jgi:hypothetical protein
MRISKRSLVTVVGAAIAALSMALTAGAFGAAGGSHRSHSDHHGKPLINESLAPSQPTDPALHGVTAGGAPWVLKNGDVQLNSRGKLDLRVKGLVIPALGTPGRVTTISASLYCHPHTTAADTTQQVPISRKGDARIHDTSFNVPSTCLMPVILVHPNGVGNVYIALDGWRL